ncbi:MAG: cell division protein SepF [Acidimicrobiales bacterium]
MAGMVRRAMVYLGLVDDDYEEYEGYDDGQQPQSQPAQPQARPARAYGPEPHEPVATSSSIRTLPREAPSHETVGPVSPVNPRPSLVRPISAAQNAKVHVIAPMRFPDAQEIGDRLKASQPVIVNLQSADRELSRRMIDFCSGAAYVLGGSMDKVADQVFLLTPSNVEVSAEEKRRLQERGLYRT